MNVYIENANISSFGALHDREYLFDKGVNVLEGKNESGKSTLAAFIKFMFYGVSGKSVGGISEKSRWTSWKYGVLAGSMTVNKDGVSYRIERSLTPSARGAGKETVKLIDLSTSEEVKLTTEVGEFFFGISAEVYAQTAFTGQKNTDSLDSKTVKGAIENMLFSGSEELSTKAAISKLESARVALLHKNLKGGKLYELTQKEDELYKELEVIKNASKELDYKKKEIEAKKAEIEENNKKIELLEKYLQTARAREVLEDFEEYDRVLAEYNQKQSEKESVVREATVNGFIPGEDYITDLRSTNASYVYCLREENDANSRLMSMQAEHDRLASGAPSAVLELAGGKDTVITKVDAANVKVKKNQISFSLFALFSAVWLIASFLSLGIKSAFVPSPIILFSISSLLVLASLAVGFFLLKARRERKELYKRYGITSYADMYKTLARYEADAKKRTELSDQIETLKEGIAKNRARMDRISKESAELLKKWGREFSDMTDVEKASEDARATVDRIGALTSDISSLYASLCKLKRTLAEKDREKARATVAAVSTRLSQSFSYAEAEEGLRKLAAINSALDRQCKSAELEFAASVGKYDDPTDILERIEALSHEKERLSELYSACLLAIESLSRAGEDMRNSIAPRVAREIESFSNSATGAEKNMTVDADMLVSFREGAGDMTHSEAYLSGGTKDLVYIAMRLSLAKLLCKDKVPPMIFDESFCQIDKERLERVMKLLDRFEGVGQIIILTSNSREREALDKIRNN
ncbi:MAG: AAA family ATPase [Clostridia bacterium]|nr:AAA family ATPase [Clostridia bacterium]